MFSLKNGINTAEVYPRIPEFPINLPFEKLLGDVFICSAKACWMANPKENDYISRISMGSYREIFQDRGEFILCLEVNVRNHQCGNWAKHSFNLPQLKGDFPRCLPLEIFFGKNAGDKVEIVCNEMGNHFILNCSHDNFEGLVEEAFMTIYCEFNGKYQKGHLSLEDQKKWRIVDEIKCTHYPNL